MTPSAFAVWAEATLGSVWMLRGVPEDTLLELGSRCEWQSLPVGHKLFVPGELTRRVAFVTRGTVRVRGRQSGQRDDQGAGTTLGLMSVFAKRPATLEAQALSPVTVAWLDREDLTDAMTRCAHLAEAVAHEISLRVRNPIRNQDDERERLDGRVAIGLVVAGSAHVRADGIATLPSLPDVSLWAALLGVTEAALRQSFARLERAKLVRTVAGERMHVDVAGLKARVRR